MNRKYLITAVLVLVGFGVGFLLGGWNYRQEYVKRLLSVEAREKEVEKREEGLDGEIAKMQAHFDGELDKVQEWMEFFGLAEIEAFEDYVKMRPPLKDQKRDDYVKQFKEYRKWLESR